MEKVFINFIEYNSNYFLKQENIIEFSAKHIYGANLFFFLNDWFGHNKTLNIQTSGTTGNPKIFEVEKWKLANSAKRTIAFFNLHNNQNFLLSLPLDFIAGKLMVIRTILAKANLITQDISSSPLLPYLQPIDFGAVTPVQLERSIKKYGIDELPSIKHLLVGGAPISQNLTKMLKGFKGEIYESFGMTETFTHVALRKVYPTEEKCFTLLQGIKAFKEQGKLVLESNDFLNEKIYTNDYVEFYSDTEFSWLGRSDFTINSGGLKFQPEEIEAKLSKHLNFPFAIVGKPDLELGEKVVLVIEGNHELGQLYFEELPKNSKPRAFVKVEQLPRSSAGKLLRKELIQLVNETLDIPI